MGRENGTGGRARRGNAEQRLDRFLVKKGEHLCFLEVDEIDWALSQDNYVLIHAGKQKHLVRRTLRDLEQDLDHRFARISRSALVNLTRVEHFVPWFSGGYMVQMASGTRLKLTRRFARRLFKRVGRPC